MAKRNLQSQNSPNLKNKDHSLFKKLTKLFSGPIVTYRAKIATKNRGKDVDKYKGKFKSFSDNSYKRESYFYDATKTHVMATQTRMERYIDFDQMEFNPLLASGLDLYSAELTTHNEFNDVLKIECSNDEIKIILETLFYDVLAVDANLFYWCRNLVKYGDFFMYLDIDEKMGIKSVIALPTIEIDRIEGEDDTNPNYVQFKWNAGGLVFEYWQIAHFRILGNDKYNPFGTSVLDSARRTWRMITMMEDSMMSYRITRSSEKQIFNVEVGGMSEEDIPNHMQAFMTAIKRNQVVDPETGRLDLRYAPLCHFGNDFVYLCDGTRKRIQEVADNWQQNINENKEVFVWSLDENNNVIPTRLLWAGKTKENAEFIEVELDNGQKIKTTPEHKWMLRNGTFKRADELEIDDSLMPYYASKNNHLTKRFSSKNNFYVDIYEPGRNAKRAAHRIVADWKYGETYYPDVIHHNNEIKFDSNPSNLIKMTHFEHQRLHRQKCTGLIAYSRSPEGREISRKNILALHKKFDMSKILKGLWKTSKFRNAIVEKLTVKIDENFSLYVLNAIEKLGTEAREYEIRSYLNNDTDFKDYFSSLNKDFNNGFKDKLTKNQFRYCLRRINIKNVREAKTIFSSKKLSWEQIVEICEKEKPRSRKDIFKRANLTKYDFKFLVEQNGLTIQEFDKKYLNGGYYCKSIRNCIKCNKEFSTNQKDPKKYCSHSCYSNDLKGKKTINKTNLLNHKVTSVRKCDFLADAYGLTVESSTHVLAVGGENAELIEGLIPQDGVFIHNSVEDNYYFPVVDGKGTTVTTLPAGANTTAIDDIKYFKALMFAAIKIPEAYLASTEVKDDSTTLSQKDVHFARAIQRIQRCVVVELEKIARVHLLTLGFRGDDLLNFKIKLNNPSKIAQLQELDALKVKLDVANAAKGSGLFSNRWIGHNIFNHSDEEIERIERERFYDKRIDAEIEASIKDIAGEEGPEGSEPGMGGDILGGDISGSVGGGEDLSTEPTETPPPEEPDIGKPEKDEPVDKDQPLLAMPNGQGSEQGNRRTVEYGDDGNPTRIDIGDGFHLTPGSKGKSYKPEITTIGKSQSARIHHHDKSLGGTFGRTSKRKIWAGVHEEKNPMERIKKIQDNAKEKNKSIYSELEKQFSILENSLQQMEVNNDDET